MIESKLIHALGEFLEKDFQDCRMETKNGAVKPPKIFYGYLPPKRSNGDEDFPLLLIRAEKGETDQDSTRMEVSMVIGCYSKDVEGYEDCLNVLARIRNALSELPGGCLANRYVFNGNFSWSVPDEQPYPYFELYLTTEWMVRSPAFVDLTAISEQRR